MKKIWVLCFITLMMVSGVTFAENNTDFQNAQWGMSPDEVKKSEPNTLLEEIPPPMPSFLESYLSYQGTYEGFQCKINYTFWNNALSHGKYEMFFDNYPDPQGHVRDFQTFKEKLTQRYGAPFKDYQEWNWEDESIKSQPAKWGEAVCSGQLILKTVWKSGRKVIQLTLIGGEGVYLDVDVASFEDAERNGYL